MKDPLTSHPRFVRYLGTCFNPSKLEAYVITDYAVGCTLEDIMRNPEVREAMDMTEEGKVRAAADLADAVYFLHGHSKPVAHGAISTANVVVDGETHRGKLVARQGAERIQQLVTLKGRTAVVMSITITYSIRIFIRFKMREADRTMFGYVPFSTRETEYIPTSSLFFLIAGHQRIL